MIGDLAQYFFPVFGVLCLAVVGYRLFRGGPSAVLAGSRVLEEVCEVPVVAPRQSVLLSVRRLEKASSPMQIAVKIAGATRRGMSSSTFGRRSAEELAALIDRAVSEGPNRVEEVELGRARAALGHSLTVDAGGDPAAPIVLRAGPRWGAMAMRLTPTDAAAVRDGIRSVLAD